MGEVNVGLYDAEKILMLGIRGHQHSGVRPTQLKRQEEDEFHAVPATNEPNKSVTSKARNLSPAIAERSLNASLLGNAWRT